MKGSDVSADRRIAIVGTGFSGLCLGIHLKKLGVESFVLFEKADRIGGTWRENTYPGAECDVPSALYSFSFEQNPRWSHKWSGQSEILEYLEHCTKKYDLYPHIRFNQEVRDARFEEETGEWRIETSDGAVEQFDVLVSGVGQLQKPAMPKIEGMDRFQGVSFHSARWNHDYDMAEKRVGVIGNAASAIQFIPHIAPKVEHLTVYQRSPNWMLPKNGKKYTSFEKWLGTVFSPFPNYYRFLSWIRGEGLFYPLMSLENNRTREKSQEAAIAYIEEKIRDPKLRKDLVPDYPMGAKRVLFSDDIYDALDRNNVTVVTTPIKGIREAGVETEDGVLHEADALVYSTGFDTNSFLTPMQVIGRGGQSLNELWARDGAEAYLGITHTGFPNFFMMYGPNTNLGHNSIIVMIEAQARYILSCFDALSSRRARWLDVKDDVQRTYNEWIDERMKKMVWSAADRSWYKTEAGRVTNNWVGRTSEYRKMTRNVNPKDYEFV